MNKSFSIFFFVSLFVAGSLFFMVSKPQPKNKEAPASKVPVVAASTQTVSYIDSPEGSKTLTLEADSLYVSLKDSSDKQLLYKKVLESSELLEIPFNTWSPDTKYLFIKDKKQSGDSYLFFQSSGVPFVDEKVFVSINEEFQKKVAGYTIEDVTGWADPTLIVVNTVNNETQNKRSFWFNVQNQSFILLNTYFR